MSDSQFVLDDSRFPLIICTLSGAPDDAMFESMFVEFEKTMHRRKPYVLVTDVRALTKVANARQRQLMSDRLKAIEEKYGSLRQGSVLILESSLVRGALTALHWIMGRSTQDRIAPNMEAALDEAEKFAAMSGLTIPPSRVRLAGS